MKKIVIIFAIICLLLSCSKKNADDIIEIKERVFVGQINDIYINADDYLGKKIKVEGLFMNDSGQDIEQPLYAVFRYGPGGCCGIDGIVGLEVRWTQNMTAQYPENDLWVEAIGELKKYYAENNSYIFLDLISLNTLEKRGKEYVMQ